MLNGLKYITINTDASFSTNTQYGGFGIWITSDEGVIRTGGRFKNSPKDSLDAEIKAVLNALHLIKIRKLSFDRIVINSDCMAVINIINHKRALQRGCITSNMLAEKCTEIQNIKAKHVKGHSTKKDPRSFINRWCDGQAGSGMKSLTIKKKYKKIK